MTEDDVCTEGTGFPWGQPLAEVFAANVKALLVELLEVLPRTRQLRFAILVLLDSIMRVDGR